MRSWILCLGIIYCELVPGSRVTGKLVYFSISEKVINRMQLLKSTYISTVSVGLVDCYIMCYLSINPFLIYSTEFQSLQNIFEVCHIVRNFKQILIENLSAQLLYHSASCFILFLSLLKENDKTSY